MKSGRTCYRYVLLTFIFKLYYKQHSCTKCCKMIQRYHARLGAGPHTSTISYPILALTQKKDNLVYWYSGKILQIQNVIHNYNK